MKARNLIDLEDISLEDIDEIIHLAGMIKANPSIFTDACHGKIFMSRQQELRCRLKPPCFVSAARL